MIDEGSATAAKGDRTPLACLHNFRRIVTRYEYHAARAAEARAENHFGFVQLEGIGMPSASYETASVASMASPPGATPYVA